MYEYDGLNEVQKAARSSYATLQYRYQAASLTSLQELSQTS